MYNVLLVIHNWWRWVVLLVGLAAILTAWIGWLGKRKYENRDRMLGTFFGVSLDIQLLLGLILYFISPLIRNVLADFGTAMENQELRFMGLEHVFFMVVAVISAHIGSMLVKRASTDQGKFRRAALWFTVTMIIILIGIPWWRPLLRY